jgi:hypothetical protein
VLVVRRHTDGDLQTLEQLAARVRAADDYPTFLLVSVGAVARLLVDPNVRRRGVARALLQTARSAAVAHQRIPVLEVLESSHAAIARDPAPAPDPRTQPAAADTGRARTRVSPRSTRPRHHSRPQPIRTPQRTIRSPAVPDAPRRDIRRPCRTVRNRLEPAWVGLLHFEGMPVAKRSRRLNTCLAAGSCSVATR